MVITTPILPFAVVAVDRRSHKPLHQQIYDGLRRAILDGTLPGGGRLPSTRGLAQDLRVSRLPVLSAYDQLRQEGYLETRTGSGTYVRATIPDDALRPHAVLASNATATRLTSSRWAAPMRLATRDEGGLRPFRTSLPGLDVFPHTRWSRIVAYHARELTPAHMGYGDPAGLPRLRTAVADHLRIARAVRCEPRQVIIVSGSQAALRLCAAVLLRRGDRVAVEDPGYGGAHAALTATGADLVPVPVDDDGLDVDRLVRTRATPRACYVTPTHQYPLGSSMSAARRMALVDWAVREHSWIIEDDYDSEFRYVSRPLGALQGMGDHAAERVLYVGTFSKVLFPALRVGYLVVPRPLIDEFVAAREVMDLFSPTLYQLALATFIHEGHLARHVRRMRGVYRDRRAALLDGLTRHCDGLLALHNADAGLHAATLLPRGVDDVAVVSMMKARGLTANALSTCYLTEAAQSGLLLGFAGVNATTLAAATHALGEVLRSVKR